MYLRVLTMLEWLRASKSIEQIKLRILSLYLVLAVASLFSLALLAFLAGSPISFILNTLLACFCFILLIDLYKREKLQPNATIGLSVITLVMIYDFATGGINGWAIFWTFLLPPTAMFINRARWALVAVMFYLVTIVLLFLAAPYSEIIIDYETGQFLVYLASFISLTAISLLMNKAWDLTSQYLKTNTEALRSANKTLGKNMQILKETEKELSQKIKELEETNDIMIGRELKMKELKEKLSKLQKPAE